MILIKNPITEYVKYMLAQFGFYFILFLLNIFMLTYMFTGHHMLQSQCSQTTTATTKTGM